MRSVKLTWTVSRTTTIKNKNKNNFWSERYPANGRKQIKFVLFYETCKLFINSTAGTATAGQIEMKIKTVFAWVCILIPKDSSDVCWIDSINGKMVRRFSLIYIFFFSNYRILNRGQWQGVMTFKINVFILSLFAYFYCKYFLTNFYILTHVLPWSIWHSYGNLKSSDNRFALFQYKIPFLNSIYSVDG